MQKTVISVVLLMALASLTACAQPAQTALPPEAAMPAAPELNVTSSAVIAEGRVVPAQDASLIFELSGRVAEILVSEGDVVQAGDPLARLDTRDLELLVDQARVNLEQAKADHDRLLEGATLDQLAAAQAEIVRAQSDLQTVRSSVSQADIAAARADLASAQARLDTLQGKPNADALADARATLAQAKATLERQRVALSAVKTDAERQVNVAANALRDAQTAYAFARDNLTTVEESGSDPLNGNPLTSAGERKAANDLEIAKRAMENADAELAQARVDYETAKQNEVIGLREAEAAVEDAQTALDTLLNPNADTLNQARAQVAAAQARLDALTGTQRQGRIAAAQSLVTAAEARLEALQSPPTEATLRAAQARIKGAEVGLQQAERTLDKATLVSPITGIVVDLNMKVGEVPSQVTPVVVVADITKWQIESADLPEINVAQVQQGDQVSLSFEALPDVVIPGTVTLIKPMGETRQGATFYTMVVTPNSWDERLRWNMSASIELTEQ